MSAPILRRIWPVLAGVLAVSLAFAPPAVADPPAITPGNVPTPIAGGTNGLLPASDLIDVAPNCIAARGAAPSLGLLLRTAREEGVVLATEQCYRTLAGEIAVQNQWSSIGQSACAAPVPVGPTGPVGTSMHGWGKAVDFLEGAGSVTFGSAAYEFLKAQAGQFGWNHPGWAEPGGSACPEAWHWEWVGDGGVLGAPPIRADVVALLPSADGHGYSTVSGLGGLVDRGDAPSLGDASSLPLAWVVVGAARSPSGAGYWLAAADGGIFAFGDAGFHGSMGGVPLNQPVISMASSVGGQGYWQVASDGGIFTFGDARFYGSTGAMRLDRPVVGMAATPSGQGYWLVGSDGGIFAFGDARFYGSTGGQPLAEPIVGMARTPDGGGYWLVGADGSVHAFGDAGSFGAG